MCVCVSAAIGFNVETVTYKNLKFQGTVCIFRMCAHFVILPFHIHAYFHIHSSTLHTLMLPFPIHSHFHSTYTYTSIPHTLILPFSHTHSPIHSYFNPPYTHTCTFIPPYTHTSIRPYTHSPIPICSYIPHTPSVGSWWSDQYKTVLEMLLCQHGRHHLCG